MVVDNRGDGGKSQTTGRHIRRLKKPVFRRGETPEVFDSLSLLHSRKHPENGNVEIAQEIVEAFHHIYVERNARRYEWS